MAAVCFTCLSYFFVYSSLRRAEVRDTQWDEEGRMGGWVRGDGKYVAIQDVS